MTLDGRSVFTIKAPRAQYTEQERARDTSADLLAVAQDREVRADDIRIVPGERDSIILAGRSFLMALTDEDAALEGRSREDLVQERARSMVAAIVAYRDRRAAWNIARNVALLILYWTGCAALLVLLRSLTRKAVVRLDARSQGFLASRNLDAVHQHYSKQLYGITDRVVRLLAGIIGLGIVSVTTSYSLGLFPETAAISQRLLDRLTSGALFMLRTFVGYLPNLLVIVVVIALTYWLIRSLGSLARALESEELHIPGFSAEWARPTNRLLSLVLAILAVVVAFPYLPGGDSPAFRGISIFIGVLVSLGSGSAMGNLVAGIILTYMRPFRVGDRVKIAETVGDVMERSFLVTRLRTIKNVLIVVPNHMILTAHIHNYTAAAQDAGLIVHTSVTIGYSAPWRTVHRLLIEAALGTEDVLSEPRPFVLQTSLNDFHISYQVNAFTRAANRMEKIVTEIHLRIQDEFNKAGVEIMSPSYLSLRDGNATAIPDADLPAGYAAPGFRVQMDADGVRDVVHG